MSAPATRQRRDPRVALLNLLLGLLVVIVGFLGYALVRRTVLRPTVEAQRAAATDPAQVIQIDVLNGCGADGAGTLLTAYLRARGYDVVDVRNYKSFDVRESLVIDRTGDRRNAERVASALGVRGENILQQINHDYYVDVSVVIGKDHRSLNPSH